MRSLASMVVTALLVQVAVAHADAKAEASQAFTAFVEGVAGGRSPTVELFIPPGFDEHVSGDSPAPVIVAVPSDHAATRATLAGTKLTAARVVVSKGGRSAWIAGTLPGRVKRGKSETAPETIRASAFLVKDGGAWRVTATHWSVGVPDHRVDGCGLREDWQLAPSIAKDAQPAVAAVYDALNPGFEVGEGLIHDTAKFGKLLSGGKDAYVFGSAPKEVFSGGTKIKSVFKKWEIHATKDGASYPARAGVGPDGEMMWLALGVIGPEALCVTYRTLLVLAKESGGWRVVHQHYSQPGDTGY